MASMTGKTVAAWQQHIRQDSEAVFALLKEHLHSLSAEDNTWLIIASESQLQAQLDYLIPLYRNNPEAYPLFDISFAVKDNIDVAGWPTSAVCPAFTYWLNRMPPPLAGSRRQVPCRSVKPVSISSPPGR